MNRTISRRAIITGGTTTGAALLGAYAGASAGLAADDASPLSQLPWPYQKLDPEGTRSRAYGAFFEGGCMYAVVEAVAGQVAEGLGDPYTRFPFKLSTYGGGGVSAWGTLCGTCNGAAMALSFFRTGRARSDLVSELFAWYEDTPLPTHVPAAPVRVARGFEMPSSRAGSTLCHVSITRWVRTAAFESFSPQRLERCARVAADVAGRVAELLNRPADAATGRLASAQASECLGCHAKGKQTPGEPEVESRMECATCHEPHEPEAATVTKR
jgi:hypothetical protein